MSLESLSFAHTLLEHFDIELVVATRDRVRLRMPIGPKVLQPHGMLHGGASVALAESAASIGATLNIDTETQQAVGIEINANHLRAVRQGHVVADAVPLHRGRHSMVWSIEIHDSEQHLACIARCTIAVLPLTRACLDVGE